MFVKRHFKIYLELYKIPGRQNSSISKLTFNFSLVLETRKVQDIETRKSKILTTPWIRKKNTNKSKPKDNIENKDWTTWTPPKPKGVCDLSYCWRTIRSCTTRVATVVLIQTFHNDKPTGDVVRKMPEEIISTSTLETLVSIATYNYKSFGQVVYENMK